MKVMQELQGAYFKYLSTNITTPIFNYVPEKAPYPFVKIGRIEAYPWLIIPLSYIIKLDYEIYSQNTSNIEILRIINELDDAVSKYKPKLASFKVTSVEIEDTKLDPSHNGVWYANLSLKLHIVKS